MEREVIRLPFRAEKRVDPHGDPITVSSLHRILRFLELSSVLSPASEPTSAPGIYFCSRVSFNDFERRKQE
jgi:hypothetical protein